MGLCRLLQGPLFNMNALKYISQSRAQLMAFAILGVLFVHSGIKIPYKFLNSIVQMGYGGVDLFFFLSGFGLFCSCQKDDKCLTFWWKRIKRIMPAYVICILITQLVLKGKVNWTNLWQDCLFVGYWIRPLKWHYFAWFISGIMGLYLIYPLYYKIFRRYPIGATIHASLVGIFCAGIYSYYFLVLHPKGCNAFIHLFARTPIFFIGTLFAYLYEKEKMGNLSIRKEWLLVMLVLPFVGYKILGIVTHMGLTYNQLRNSGSIFYPFIIIIPGFAVALGFVLSHCHSVIKTVLGWVGNSTLETYLLIGVTFHYQKTFIKLAGGSNIVGCLLMIVTCIMIACFIHYALRLFTNFTYHSVAHIYDKRNKHSKD